MRKLSIMFVLILLTLNLTSCYDAHEIDEQLHVLVIGIDLGRTDKWRLTLQVMIVDASDSGNTESQSAMKKIEEEDIITVEAPSFFAGINLLSTFRARRIEFHHAHVIVFSEELAKSGRVSEFISPINRFIEIRPSARIIVVKGRADKFLKENQPLLGSLISEDLRLLLDQSENTGFFQAITLHLFYCAVKSPFGQAIAPIGAVNELKALPDEGEPWGTEFKPEGGYIAGEIPRQGENKIEFLGTALFRGDTMVGELTGEETRYMLMARGEFKQGFFTVQDPKKPELIIALDVKGSKKLQINVDITGPEPLIDLKISLDANILAIQSDFEYERPELKALLEKTFADIVKSGVEEVIKKCQDLNTDVFLFGTHITSKFLVINDLEDYKWNERFENSQVNVEVVVSIRRSGRLLRV